MIRRRRRRSYLSNSAVNSRHGEHGQGEGKPLVIGTLGGPVYGKNQSNRRGQEYTPRTKKDARVARAPVTLKARKWVDLHFLQIDILALNLLKVFREDLIAVASGSEENEPEKNLVSWTVFPDMHLEYRFDSAETYIL
jgi:hypothetical protein